MGVNYFASVLLTLELEEMLKKSSQARILFVSSGITPFCFYI